MSESNYAKRVLPKWQADHPNARVMRNNTGMAWQGENTKINAYRKGKYGPVRILKNPRPVYFGVGLPTKTKSGRTIQKGGGDYIGWESIEIAAPCCGSCVINESCNLIYNELYPYHKNHGLIWMYQKLKKCFCNGALYRPDNIEKVAVFLNLETKSKDGKETPDQIKFRKRVIEAGGISIILKEGEDYE